MGPSGFLTRSSTQVQAWPVHQTRPNRGAGLRRLGPWDSKTSSSREVSRDRQRLHRQTQAELVDDLRSKPTPDSRSSQVLSKQIAASALSVPPPAGLGRLQFLSRQNHHSLFFACLSKPTAVSLTAESPPSSQFHHRFPFLFASKPERARLENRLFPQTEPFHEVFVRSL